MFKAIAYSPSFAERFVMTSQRRIGSVQLLIIQEKFLLNYSETDSQLSFNISSCLLYGPGSPFR